MSCFAAGKDPRKLQKGTLMVTSLKECKKNYTSLESKYIITKKHVSLNPLVHMKCE